MRSLRLILALLTLAGPAYAQQWDQVNGSMQVRSGPTTPLVIIDQTNASTNNKILSLRANGTEKCSVDVDGDLVCAGSFEFVNLTFTGQAVGPLDTDCSAPAYSGLAKLTTGFAVRPAPSAVVCVGGTLVATHSATQALLADAIALEWSDVSLSRGAANRLDLATGDSLRLVSGGLGVGVIQATAGFISSSGPAVTAPTDSTAVDAGTVTLQRSSSTITPATGGAGNCGAAFLAAALTADCTIATLPAGMQLKQIYAEVTAGFTCSGTCSGTKVVQCGTAAGGTEVLAAAFDVTAAGVAGDADAELGPGLVRAAAIQGGLLGSWASTTPISCRFTSGTGNWGDAVATFVNAGSIKFTLVTQQLK